MRKIYTYLLVLSPILGYAQPNERNLATYNEMQLQHYMQGQMSKIDWSKMARTTGSDTPLYYVPVVFHAIHDYGSELVQDTNLYKWLPAFNQYMLKTTPDTSAIIDKFKPIAANSRIAFVPARKDPNGISTKGVEHIYSYQTYGKINIEQEKLNQWPQDRYLNIWLVNNIYNPLPGGLVVSYTTNPSKAQTYPYYDGIVFNYYLPIYHTYANGVRDLGKYLGLNNLCGPTICTDGDLIADTPPCISHLLPTCNFYDTTCDTPNIQNLMNSYNNCKVMFTNGQATYMQLILNQDIGKRDSLVSSHNYIAAGMNQPMPDLPPVADLSVQNSLTYSKTAATNFFQCIGSPFYFKNQSWNDTISSVQWAFSNSPDSATSTGMGVVKNRFFKPGWVTVSLQARSNAGNNAITKQAVYVADTSTIDAHWYWQEFDSADDLDKWPIFNYYNNNFKWQVTHTVGFYDNNSICYLGYDNRALPAKYTGGPEGDFDDFFSRAFDLSGFGTGNCNINFMAAGIYNTTKTYFMNDSLSVSYSTDCGSHWNNLKTLKGNEIGNNGSGSLPYTPLSISDWKLQSIDIPASARSNKVFFRFRYYPGADSMGMSTGNNFYLDRINISNYPLGLNTLLSNEKEIAIYPNPGKEVFNLQYNFANNENATVYITDITGRNITSLSLNGKSGSSVINAKEWVPGIYLFKVIQAGAVINVGKIIKE